MGKLQRIYLNLQSQSEVLPQITRMTAAEIRQTFLDFFKEKGHLIVPSAPLVVKNDPTLMFTNAGMNQFKDYFLGNKPAPVPRIADTQKCLRVSGKHNDLEEVGLDTYHHTMFEMLGNWSFGDYFKKDAVDWSWELLTKRYNLPIERLYVTVFGGDEKDGLPKDEETYQLWLKYLPAERVLFFNKKDNFWEMGDTGPCGPCTEIHIDLRDEAEIATLPGVGLVNDSHPQVIEIWNNVFMEFNRMADGSLVKLPAQSVDTGMGFERLCMAIQGKKSNYDTDVFTPLIHWLETKSQISYGKDEKSDIAMRVIADHIRAISFAIADGQLPGNAKAGYVIRRILRRAVRYGYTFLSLKQPFLFGLVPVLAQQMAVFPELNAQKDFVARVIEEEEKSFLRTLETGLKRFEVLEAKNNQISGRDAFELLDTYGFPLDLTALLAREKGWEVDEKGFESAMSEQKNRSRKDAEKSLGDWIEINPISQSVFVGYDQLNTYTLPARYRLVETKGKKQIQLVLEQTPFYGESGGQVGDKGLIELASGMVLQVVDTQKEMDLIVHYVEGKGALEALENLEANEFVTAKVNPELRLKASSNHSATHLLHAALQQHLGDHIAQKGSLVSPDVLRFDFSHFAKVEKEELVSIEEQVNQKIRENIALEDLRSVPIEEAKALGAKALFGEKYGDSVRVVIFDRNYSMELCGGTHVPSTGAIGLFKIKAESAVAAGVRRIEALTGKAALDYIRSQENTLLEIKEALGGNPNPIKAIQDLQGEKAKFEALYQDLVNEKANVLKKQLLDKAITYEGTTYIIEAIEAPNAEVIKNISFELRKETSSMVLLLAANLENKPQLSLMFSDDVIGKKNLNAAELIRGLAKHIQGGGGGQNFYATAGGKNLNGIEAAVNEAKALLLPH